MGVSLRKFAALVGVSHQAVSKRVSNGTLSTEPDGTVDPVRGRAEWDENRHPGARHGSTNGTSGYATARTARETLTARLLELEYRQRIGELVEVEQVREAAFRVGRLAHDVLMSVPDRLTAVLATVSDRTEMHRLLTAEMQAVVDQMAGVVPVPKRTSTRARARGRT